MIQAFIFDVYGTLFNEDAVDGIAEKLYPGKGGRLGVIWREKQNEYTFVRQITGRYRPFNQIAADSLRYAANAVNVVLTPEAERRLMEAYNQLPPHADAAALLYELQKRGKQTIGLSNGTLTMLAALLHNSGLEMLFDWVISADECRQYKPSTATYSLVLDHTCMDREKMVFVSAHGWDTAGAANFGFQTAWINRGEQPQDEYRLPPDYEYLNLLSVLKTIE